MKHFLSLSLLILALTASGYDFKVDNVCYNITSIPDKTCSVAPETADGGYSGELIIPSSVTFEGIDFAVTSIDYYAFERNYDLKSVVIPPSVLTVGNGAFESCYGLETVIIQDSSNSLQLGYNKMIQNVTGQGQGTFFKSSLSHVYIGRPLTYVNGRYYGYTPFNHCNIKSVEFGSNITVIPERMFCGCEKLENVVFPTTITSIQSLAFSSCKALKEINLNQGLKTIGTSAFGGIGISELEIPSSVETVNGSFSGCSQLTKVRFGSNETKVEQYSFSNCTSLVDIELPSTMTVIPQSLFEGCSSLKNVEIPSGVTNLDYSAFCSCSSLETLKLPEGLENIGSDVFYNCENLINITLPASVSFVGFHSFQECPKLKTITCLSTTPPACDEHAYENHPFDNITYLTATLYVPAESIESYKATSPWNMFVHTEDVANSGTESVSLSSEPEPIMYIDCLGNVSTSPFQGFNVVRYSDGSSSKVIHP